MLAVTVLAGGDCPSLHHHSTFVTDLKEAVICKKGSGCG